MNQTICLKRHVTMWKTVLLVTVISVCWRLTAGTGILVDICENKTLTMNSIFLQRNNKNSSTNCWCTIISANGSSIKVQFNVSIFKGQQYKLSVSNGTSTSYFENSMSPDIFYNIRSEEIKLKLEEQTCSANDSLEFGIDIYSNSGGFNITCHKPTVSTPELCTQTTSEVTTTSAVTTTSTVTTKHSLVTTSTGTYTNITSSSVKISSTGKASEGSTNSQNDTSTRRATTGELDIVLIGGLVGGAVLLIVIILILIICLVRRKRRKKDGYDRPSPARLPPDVGHVDVDIGLHGNDSSKSEMIIDDNPVYHSYINAESVSPRHINTNQGSDNPIQMEIIENDLYVSSDDVVNSNQIPVVEYAAVNKKPKSDEPSKVTSVDSGVSMSSNEPKSDHDRQFVLGPKGDEYTLVTKT